MITDCNKNESGEVVLGEGSFGRVVKHFSTKLKSFVARKVFYNTRSFEVERKWLRLIQQATPTEDDRIIHMYGVIDCLRACDLELAQCSLWNVAFHSSGEQKRCPALRSAVCVSRVANDCIRGLSFLHEKVLISHNDVKPQNLLFFENGSTKITDFGLCTMLSEQMRFKIGTLEYTAPEIFSETPEQEGKNDVFSLGVALYQIIEGVLPTALSNEFIRANRAFERAGAAKSSKFVDLKKAAAEFYADDFHPAVSGGGNVVSVRRSVAHLIAEMCCVDLSVRPTSKRCLQLLATLRILDRDTVQWHNPIFASSSASFEVSFCIAAFESVEASVQVIPNCAASAATACVMEIRLAAQEVASCASTPNEFFAALNAFIEEVDFENFDVNEAPASENDFAGGLQKLAEGFAKDDRFEAVSEDQKRLIPQLRKRGRNDVITQLQQELLEVLFSSAIIKKQHVFFQLTGFGVNWWKKSKRVSELRKKYGVE
jgi:hypothetical protein